MTVEPVVILGTNYDPMTATPMPGDVVKKQTLRPFKPFRPYTKSLSYLKEGKLGWS